jgi:1,4-dihydroxy-2-naphthoate octaprenyltransferase
LDIDHQFLQHLFPGLSIDRDRRKNKAVYAGLILILICLGGWAIIQFVLLQMGDLPAGALIWLGLIVLDVLLLSVPAIRLSNSGYAELMQAMLLFGLIPIYAYQALTGEYHVLMVLICLPLTFFYLATRLVHALFHYTEDQQSGRLNFLQLTGWKQGMTIHNLFVLLGYLTYACIPLFRFPTHIFLSPLITLPVGLILIGLMFRIERGKKPVWNSFLLLEKGLMFLVIYFLTAALILR